MNELRKAYKKPKPSSSEIWGQQINPIEIWGKSSAGVEEQGKCVCGMLRNLGELTGSGIVNKAATRASGE